MLPLVLLLLPVKAPNGLTQTINQRFKPWFKPMVFKRFNNFLNRFKTGLGFQTNRLTIDLYDYFIDIFNIWIAASWRSGKTSATGPR